MFNKNISRFPIIYANSGGTCRIAIGWGAHTTVADEAKRVGIKKALIVTTGLKGTGIIEELKGILEYNGVPVEIYSGVTSNPKDHEVMAGYKAYIDGECDGVISIGGGSSHDCAKGIRLVAANDGADIGNFKMTIDPPWQLDMTKYRGCMIPQVSVNTTAGTGAEMSGGGAITHTKERIKRMAVAPGLTPAAAIEDPLLIRCQPGYLAAQTAWDGFTHAFEIYVSCVESHYSQSMAIYAIKLISDNLREFAYNRMNRDACEAITWASSMSGGIALGLGGGTGLVHGLGHGLSILYNVHHGLANAVMTIPGERYNQPERPEKFAEMARAMGANTFGMTKMEASDAWFYEVERLLDDLEIESGNLSRFGLKKEDIPHIVQVQHYPDLCNAGNPREYNYDDLVQLMENILDEPY
ncbi:MAG: iron-containing alcohol dehydrogenase [Dehalococcoidia bacterium]